MRSYCATCATTLQRKLLWLQQGQECIQRPVSISDHISEEIDTMKLKCREERKDKERKLITSGIG